MADGGEDYAEIPPPAALRPFIRTIWTYRAASPQGAVQRIAPDGCPELVFDRAAPYEEQDQAGVWRVQPLVIFAGQMTRPMALRPTGPVDVLAVRFEPDGARDFLGLPLSAATDQRLDMTGRGLPDQIEPLLAVLETARRTQDWRLDPEVRAHVDAVHADAGHADAGHVDTPSETLDPARRRRLQRAFRDRVGVSLQTLRSVLRFRRVFDHAIHAEDDRMDWLSAGLEAGYFDQPQMARDFRRFLGCTATDWAREQHELAHHIASSSYKPQA